MNEMLPTRVETSISYFLLSLAIYSKSADLDNKKYYWGDKKCFSGSRQVK